MRLGYNKTQMLTFVHNVDNNMIVGRQTNIKATRSS